MAKPEGGLESRVQDAPAHGPKKSIADRATEFTQKVAENTEGFVGTAITSTATSYMMTQALPVFFANPIAGVIYGSLLGTSAFISTNMARKLIGGTVGFAYNTLRHPIETVGSAFDKLAEYVTHPLQSVTKLVSSPKVIFDYLFRGGKSNKYGKFLGTMIGGGLGLNKVVPDFMAGITGGLSHSLTPAFASASQGTSMFANSAYGAVEEGKDLAKDMFWNYYFTR